MPELRERIPNDKVDLRLLLVGGQSHNFLFPPSATGREIVQHVFESWPSEWSESRDCIAKPDNSQVLRLIYRGRFLSHSTTLASLSLPIGKTSVLHLVIRETLPDNEHQGQSDSQIKTPDHMQSRCCVIL